MTSAVIAGDTLPAFIGTLPSSHALVREYDTRGNGGGFAPCEPLWRCVIGVSEPWMAQIPPLGRGEVAVLGGKAPKSQTTSVKNSENGWVVAEVVCVLGTTVPGLVWWSHANR